MTIYIEVQNHDKLVCALMLRMLTVSSADPREYKKWNRVRSLLGAENVFKACRHSVHRKSHSWKLSCDFKTWKWGVQWQLLCVVVLQECIELCTLK